MGIVWGPRARRLQVKLAQIAELFLGGSAIDGQGFPWKSWYYQPLWWIVLPTTFNSTKFGGMEGVNWLNVHILRSLPLDHWGKILTNFPAQETYLQHFTLFWTAGSRPASDPFLWENIMERDWFCSRHIYQFNFILVKLVRRYFQGRTRTPDFSPGDDVICCKPYSWPLGPHFKPLSGTGVSICHNTPQTNPSLDAWG